MLGDLVDGVECNSVMELKVGRGEAAQDGLVISVDGEPPSLDLADEMPDGQLDGQEITPIIGVEALFRRSDLLQNTNGTQDPLTHWSRLAPKLSADLRTTLSHWEPFLGLG